MRLSIITIFILIFFQACSLKTPKNQWEYNSSSAFSSYVNNFLTSEFDLANDDLNKAVKYAKQSANLNQLGGIYLGSCALNISVGIKDECKEYNQIKELLNSEELSAYYSMLQNKIDKKQIEFLPKQYQSFQLNKLSNIDNIFTSIKSIEEVSSQFIAASLVIEHLKKSEIKYLLDKASSYGYKSLVLFYLKNLYNIEEDIEQKQLILKKIKILQI